MSSSSQAVEHFLSVDLPKRLINDYTDFMPLFEEIGKLVNVFKQGTWQARKDAASKVQTNINSYRAALGDTIAALQRSQADQLKRMSLTLKQQEEKSTILKELNTGIELAARFLGLVQFSVTNASKGIGACQELAELSIGILTYCEGEGAHQHVLIETLQISCVLNPLLNHELVVLNRNPLSAYHDVTNWGRDCVIFDPFMKKLYSIETIPSNLILYSFLQEKEKGKYKIDFQMSNDFRCSQLSPFLTHPLFGDIVKISIDGLERNFFSILKDLISSIDLSTIPRLSAPFSPGIERIQEDSTSLLITHLKKRSHLSFNTVMTKDYYTHVYAEINNPEQEEEAKGLITQFGYGKIIKKPLSSNMLFFYHSNSDEHCKPFRDKLWEEWKNDSP